jgi:hypothetical protein
MVQLQVLPRVGRRGNFKFCLGLNNPEPLTLNIQRGRSEVFESSAGHVVGGGVEGEK